MFGGALAAAASLAVCTLEMELSAPIARPFCFESAPRIFVGNGLRCLPLGCIRSAPLPLAEMELLPNPAPRAIADPKASQHVRAPRCLQVLFAVWLALLRRRNAGPLTG